MKRNKAIHIPCPSEYRAGDENIPSSPYYIPTPKSECCGVDMPDYDECDLCPKCKEHTGLWEGD